MAITWWSLAVLGYLSCTAAAAAAAPGRYSTEQVAPAAPSTQSAPPGRAPYRARQYYYASNTPQLQRLELADENADVQYFQPNQRRQGASPGKLETLEPDAELIPGAQQAPAVHTQVPVSPAGGIPGILPGQQFYVVNPQQQFYPGFYPGLPNGFRPNVQLPGPQRVYIVQATPPANAIYPAGYQTPLLLTQGGQQIIPQNIDPNLQRLISHLNSQGAQPFQTPGPAPNVAEAPKNYEQPIKYQEQNKNFVELAKNYQEPNKGAEQLKDFQQANYVQPQFSPGYGTVPGYIGRNVEFPFHQGIRNEQFATQFEQQFLPLFQHLGPYGRPVTPNVYAGAANIDGGPQGGFVEAPAGSRANPPQAEGRNDDNYEETKADVSTESNNYEESTIQTKKTEDKQEELVPEEFNAKEKLERAVKENMKRPRRLLK